MQIEIGFQIFHEIFYTSFFLKKEVKIQMKRINISEAEARFLFFIGLGKGERNISQLISFSRKHKSTVRQKIKSLEERGLVSISRCKIDRREKKISFTEKGKKTFQKTLSLNKKFQEEILKRFSEKEKKQLLNLLKKINVGPERQN